MRYSLSLPQLQLVRRRFKFLSLCFFFKHALFLSHWCLVNKALRGAATLKARRSCKINRLNGSAPVLPIEDSSDLPPEFDKNTSLLAQGTDLLVERPDGI